MSEATLGRILISATLYFPDSRSAERNGIDPVDQRVPRNADHVLVRVGRFVIEEADWTARQARIDDALERVLSAAASRAARFFDQDGQFILRLGLDPSGDQMSFALGDEFLRRWGALGGEIAIDA